MNSEPVIDTGRSAWFGNVYAAVTVLPNGEEQLWLLSTEDGAESCSGCCCATCAPHDQLSQRVTA